MNEIISKSNNFYEESKTIEYACTTGGRYTGLSS